MNFGSYWNVGQDPTLTQEQVEKEQAPYHETVVTYKELAETMESILSAINLIQEFDQESNELKLLSLVQVLQAKNILMEKEMQELESKFDEINKIAEDELEQ